MFFDNAGDLFISMGGNTNAVITSYSIHYTKLYDSGLARRILRLELKALAVAAIAVGLVLGSAPFTAPVTRAAEPRVVSRGRGGRRRIRHVTSRIAGRYRA